MVKVRTSQIPEEDGKVEKYRMKLTHKDSTDEYGERVFNEEKESSSPIPNYIDSDEDEKKNWKPMIKLSDGTCISIHHIITIEKDIRILQSQYTDEVKVDYGIVINKGIEASRYPRVDLYVWYATEELRDQSYDTLLLKLSELGFKFIEC
jgi:hypothetical protein